MTQAEFTIVIAGLDPAIHAIAYLLALAPADARVRADEDVDPNCWRHVRIGNGMDGRVKPGHDG